MNPRETLRIAFRAVRANRLRSALTMLGIVIGVAALIAMVAIGGGARERVAEQIRSLGTNLLLVQPGSASRGAVRVGAGSDQSLTEQDAAAIAAEIPGAPIAAPTLSGNAQIVRGRHNWFTVVAGVTPDYLVARDWRVQRGRAFTLEDLDRAAKVVLLGSSLAETLFGDADPVGQQVRIAGVPFTVIGVLGRKGQNAGSGRDQDDVALLPLSTAKMRIVGARSQANRHSVDFILVKASSMDAMPLVEEQIRQLLRQRHRLSQNAEDDFQVHQPAASMAAQADAARALTLLLAAVASVSLVVGGISIMNIMLVSVTERTREIGLRQAVGARRRDVRNQFLVEATILSLFGGLVGVAFGIGTAIAIAELAGWPVVLSPPAILLAFASAAVVGVTFGYYPACKASRLDPIDALRYE